MISLSLTSLRDYLRKKKYDAQIQEETQQVYVVLKIAEREFPLFFRVFESSHLLQLIVFLPGTLKQSCAGDVARLLHILNKELDIPGFGMDEDSQVIFYRCMLPASNHQIDETLVEAFLNSIQLICKSFSPVILAVAFGAASFEEVLKKAKDAGLKASSQQK